MMHYGFFMCLIAKCTATVDVERKQANNNITYKYEKHNTK